MKEVTEMGKDEREITKRNRPVCNVGNVTRVCVISRNAT
jgi:hypothetical protein